MKRETFLKDLSSHHHDGLVITRRIRQGVEAGFDPDEIGRYILDKWDHLLAAHFELEEMFLTHPTKYCDPESALIESMNRDHFTLSTLIHAIRENADANKLTEFADRLTAHIRFEEREFFPYLQEILSQDLKNKIEQCLDLNQLNGSKDWPVQFWKKQNQQE